MSERAKLILVVVILAAVLLMAPVAVKVVATKAEEAKLSRLLPHVRQAVETIRARLAARGIKTIVGSTRRTDAEQRALVAAGKSATENSWHKLGRGIDLYPVGKDGGIAEESEEPLYRAMVQEAKLVGAESLAYNADWSRRYITTRAGKVWDAGHLQWTGGMTFAQAQAQDAKAVG